MEILRKLSEFVQAQCHQGTKKPRKKWDEQKFHARFLRECQTSSMSKVSRWQRRTGAKGRSARPRRRERSKRRSRMQPSAQGKRSKNSAILHIMWRSKAMVPREVRAHCSIVRLAKRREGFGEQSLADVANLPLTGRGAFVLDGAKRFLRSFCTQKGSVLPSCIRNNGKCGHMKVWQ